MSSIGLDRVVDVIDRLEGRHLAVSPEYCARVRHRHSACRWCLEICPVGAIAWDDGLHIDAQACTGCGLCATACPTAALEAAMPSNIELLARVKATVEKSGRVAFACPRTLEAGRNADHLIPVPCLGRLDESILVGAVAHGARSVGLLDGGCEGCSMPSGRLVASAIVMRSNALLQVMGLTSRVEMGPGQLPNQPGASSGGGSGVSRREWFRQLLRETARMGEAAAETMSDEAEMEKEARMPRGELPALVPTKRALLLAGLRCLDRPTEVTLGSEADGLFAQFGFSEACTGCQMCAFFCPTGALSKAAIHGEEMLIFGSAYCTDCGLCRDLCYRDAVHLSHETDLNRVLDDAVRVLHMPKKKKERWNGFA